MQTESAPRNIFLISSPFSVKDTFQLNCRPHSGIWGCSGEKGLAVKQTGRAEQGRDTLGAWIWERLGRGSDRQLLIQIKYFKKSVLLVGIPVLLIRVSQPTLINSNPGGLGDATNVWSFCSLSFAITVPRLLIVIDHVKCVRKLRAPWRTLRPPMFQKKMRFINTMNLCI